MEKNIEREFSIIEELETSISLIKYGLHEVQIIDGGNDFYHVLMLTLASGFERLLKVIICLSLTEKNGAYPNEYPWDKRINGKYFGHDLNYLLNFILEKCFSEEYLTQSGVAHKDISFLKDDHRLREFVNILSGFGKSARYHNLDVYKGANVGTLSPSREWQKLETLIVREHPEFEQMLANDINLNKTYGIINKEIVIQFEKFARALSRLFTIGHLSERAKQLSPTVFDFLMLTDRQLGETKY